MLFFRNTVVKKKKEAEISMCLVTWNVEVPTWKWEWELYCPLQQEYWKTNETVLAVKVEM